jgi:hypothetical protein
MSNLKTTQLAKVKVTINTTTMTYEMVCKPEDTDEVLFKKIKIRAKSDFGNLINTENVSYEVISRKTLNS